MKRVIPLLMVLTLAVKSFAWIYINDGGTHIIDTEINDYYGVRVDSNRPDVGTYVELKAGGNITGNLIANGDSKILVSEGRVGLWLIAEDNSSVTVNGGEIVHSVRAYHNSEMLITGGIVNQYLESWGNASITVSGGRIGSIILIGYEDNSNWPEYDTSTLTLVGSDFKIDGNPITMGRYYMSDFPSGYITGTLKNGDPLANNFQIWDGASLIIIPEPTTLSLLLLGGILLRKKRK